MGSWLGGERASAPISEKNVADLRRLILRTLNDNQLLILSTVSKRRSSMTSILKSLSGELGIPLSTLKLNARILRDFNLISYGSTRRTPDAILCPLGSFVIRLLDELPNLNLVTYLD